MLETIASIWIICSLVVASFFHKHSGKLSKAVIAKIFFVILSPVALGFILSDIMDAVEE